MHVVFLNFERHSQKVAQTFLFRAIALTVNFILTSFRPLSNQLRSAIA